MKIKKSKLNKVIKNFLTEGFFDFFSSEYPYVDDQVKSDAFRRWMRKNYPKESKDPDIDITQNSGSTDWPGLQVAYERYGDEFEDDQEEIAKTKSSNDEKVMQGCVILCHWRGSKPLTKSLDKGLTRNVLETLFPQGHGGIILIQPNGKADYFDFGRYPGYLCKEKDLEKLRNVAEKAIQSIPGVKTAIATGGGVRHKSLGKVKFEEYNPSLIADPVKAAKKHVMGYGMITVSEAEAKRLVKETMAADGGLSSLRDPECFICPDVGYVAESYSYAMAQKKKCHLYSLLPITNNYNCGTFATHLALIATKGNGLRSGFWQMHRTIYDPTTQPASLIPNTARLMDYTVRFTL